MSDYKKKYLKYKRKYLKLKGGSGILSYFTPKTPVVAQEEASVYRNEQECRDIQKTYTIQKEIGEIENNIIHNENEIKKMYTIMDRLNKQLDLLKIHLQENKKLLIEKKKNKNNINLK
tara:strand:+ start:286 stop:639 length:354 start_codon:yes stop_codon:yes gene_type:complete